MKIPKQSPLKQIRKQCRECCGGSTKSIRFCSDCTCPLWYLRFGMFPKTYIRENGKRAEQLFDPDSFKSCAEFNPDKLELENKL